DAEDDGGVEAPEQHAGAHRVGQQVPGEGGATLARRGTLAHAVVAGVLLGGFNAAVSLGVSLTFGLLDVVNIAQPAFVILGSYAAYAMNSSLGVDPILTGVLFTPLFYVLGAAVYRIYYGSFERRGEESLRGLVFFFGVLFIIEVSLSLTYGVDYRLVEAPYIGKSFDLGGVGIAFRLLVPF